MRRFACEESRLEVLFSCIKKPFEACTKNGEKQHKFHLPHGHVTSQHDQSRVTLENVNDCGIRNSRDE